jgi:formiminoglutamase
VTRLPLLLSVPHAGLRVPDEVGPLCLLSPREIEEDGDEGAAEIYALDSAVQQLVTTDVARAILDMNRAETDRRKDGVVKTHTCWDVPIYRTPPSESVIESLLDRFHRTYHARLTAGSVPGVRMGLDCHTMAAVGPPVGPDTGAARPHVCLSNGDGTCPAGWLERLVRCFQREFGPNVKVNDPFTGGYITRTHAAEMPWVQVELSRAPFLSNAAKRERVLRALRAWIGETC